MPAQGFIQEKVDKLFAYGHNTTAADLTAHVRFKEKGPMHVAVTGSTGVVGSDLVPFLSTEGHTITRIVRGNAEEGSVSWDPREGIFDASSLGDTDAVVHLAGENIAGRRWNATQKKRIMDSRVDGTRLLCEALARLPKAPRVLVSASAVGFYGDRGDEMLDESSEGGDGYLAEVAQAWEQATKPALDAGIRVVNLRFGVILTPKGGALRQMLLPFKLGGGGVVGSGDQYWSWISLDDALGAIYHSLITDALTGPVNAVSPNPVTNREFTKTLGRVLSRPTIVPIPSFGARLALGELADALLLASQRVTPQRLIETQYEFRHADLEEALRHVLGR